MNGNHDNFRYLNADNRWPDFQWEGLELRHDGGLQLFSLPRLEGELPTELASLTAPDGPAGLAVDFDGTIYFSDPAGSRLLKINACDGKMQPLPFIGGEEGAPAQLATPRGLWISPQQRLLFVADSMNHRLQIFDLDSLQAVQVWGQPDPNAEPLPSAELGRFDTPSTLVADAEGNIYVVDHGNRRVQKFNAGGIVQPDFWNTLQATGLLTQPSDIAVSATGSRLVSTFLTQRPGKFSLLMPMAVPCLTKKAIPGLWRRKPATTDGPGCFWRSRVCWG
jgi:streptogramin lyase